VLEIRRRPPIVYGYSATAAEPLRAMQVDAAVEKGERLGSIPCDYVVVTEESFRHYFRLRDARFAAHRAFFAELFDIRRFREVARFETATRAMGVDVPKPFLPEDVLLVSPVTYVFERTRTGLPLAGDAVPCVAPPAR
jgi:hypothetical protein